MAASTSGGWSFDPNLVPSVRSEEMLVSMTACLVHAGWTRLARSDGTTVTSDGSANTSTQWANSNAWEHLEDPDGGREVTLERGTNDRQVRGYLGKMGAALTGGTPTAPPTSAGNVIQIIGTSGGFSGSFLHAGTFNARRHHFGAGQSAVAGDFYPFYWISRVTPGAASGYRCVMLGVDTPADGTVGDPDSEPWAGLCGIGTAMTSGQQWTGWYKAGLTGEQALVNGLEAAQNTFYRGLNPYTGGYDLSRVYIHDSTGGVTQRKGLALDMRWDGDLAHGTLDTYNLATEGDSWCIFGDMAVRWPHGVAPLS